MKSFLRYLSLIYAGQWPREVDERGGGAAWLWQDAKSNIFVPPNSTAAHLSRQKGFFKYIYITSPVSRSPVSRLLSHGLLSHVSCSASSVSCHMSPNSHLLSQGFLSHVSCLTYPAVSFSHLKFKFFCFLNQKIKHAALYGLRNP